MRKYILIATSIIGLLAISNDSFAEDNIRHVGIAIDAGIPSGASVGFVIKPKWYWFATGLSATYNGFAPGIRGSVKLDPIKFPIRLAFTTEIGHSFDGDISSVAKTDLPSISYTYVNLYPSIEFGSNNGFTFAISVGPTWMDIRTTGFQKSLKITEVSVSDPHASGWVVPTAKVGFTYLFL